MKPLLQSLLAGTVLLSSAIAAEHKYMKACPAAKEGMVRYVILLPHKDRGEDA